MWIEQHAALVNQLIYMRVLPGCSYACGCRVVLGFVAMFCSSSLAFRLSCKRPLRMMFTWIQSALAKQSPKEAYPAGSTSAVPMTACLVSDPFLQILLSAICLGSETLVCVCASWASKLSSVGSELIIYVKPRPADMTSGASYSTVQYPTPPSSSPTPDSTISLIKGATTRQVGQ